MMRILPTCPFLDIFRNCYNATVVQHHGQTNAYFSVHSHDLRAGSSRNRRAVRKEALLCCWEVLGLSWTSSKAVRFHGIKRRQLFDRLSQILVGAFHEQSETGFVFALARCRRQSRVAATSTRTATAAEDKEAQRREGSASLLAQIANAAIGSLPANARRGNLRHPRFALVAIACSLHSLDKFSDRRDDGSTHRALRRSRPTCSQAEEQTAAMVSASKILPSHLGINTAEQSRNYVAVPLVYAYGVGQVSGNRRCSWFAGPERKTQFVPQDSPRNNYLLCKGRSGNCTTHGWTSRLFHYSDLIRGRNHCSATGRNRCSLRSTARTKEQSSARQTRTKTDRPVDSLRFTKTQIPHLRVNRLVLGNSSRQVVTGCAHAPSHRHSVLPIRRSIAHVLQNLDCTTKAPAQATAMPKVRISRYRILVGSDELLQELQTSLFGGLRPAETARESQAAESITDSPTGPDSIHSQYQHDLSQTCFESGILSTFSLSRPGLACWTSQVSGRTAISFAIVRRYPMRLFIHLTVLALLIAQLVCWYIAGTM